jgi:putative addiction module component (TIGR02574 family)
MSLVGLLNQVLALEIDERAIFDQKIWESIEHFISPEVEEAWLTEAERRWQEIEEDRVKCISTEEAIKQG